MRNLFPKIKYLSKSSFGNRCRAAKMTNVSSKTYVRKLEDQLQQEKEARKKLESEVEEMRRTNSEILSRLGLLS
jgi:hypothetical protein